MVVLFMRDIDVRIYFCCFRYYSLVRNGMFVFKVGEGSNYIKIWVRIWKSVRVRVIVYLFVCLRILFRVGE